MLSSSRNALLKLFKTTSPQKLFPSDYITLYMIFSQVNGLRQNSRLRTLVGPNQRVQVYFFFIYKLVQGGGVDTKKL